MSLPGSAKIGALNANYHEVAACPQDNPLKVQAQPALTQLRRPSQGNLQPHISLNWTIGAESQGFAANVEHLTGTLELLGLVRPRI